LVKRTDNFSKKSNEGASGLTDVLGTVHSDTPMHSPTALQPLQQYPLLLKQMRYRYLLYTHAEPLGDNGHEKRILLDSWNQRLQK